MRRTNAVEVVVEGPDRGLITSVPSDLPDRARNRALVVAKNVRAEYGVLRAAPGYERVLFNPQNLDSAPNLIFQTNIINNDPEIRSTPVVGTASKLFVLLRRAKALVCDADGYSCPLTVAFLGDSGRISDDIQTVADLIQGWQPDLVVHAGDLAYASGGGSSTLNDFEEQVGQYFWRYIGGYNGLYGVGPVENKFFPVLGNHDWDDGGIDNYLDFFQLPKNPNERYYHYKRGPIHFVHLSGYSAEEPDGITEESTQGAWAIDVIENSDCPWVIPIVHFPPYCSDSSHYPGTSDLRWLLTQDKVTAVVCGHAHNAEAVRIGTKYVFITGNGGHSLRGFNGVPVDGSEFRYSSDYGALRLDATRSELTWRFYQKDGTLLHTVTMGTPNDGASGVCYIGDAGKTLVDLEVRPANAAVEVGFTWPFEAIAHYTDGSVENVTLQSQWSSSDISIATLGSTTGVGTGVSPGTIVVTAEYDGETATANLTVLHSCLDDPMEVCFAVERSESTASTASGTMRLQHIKDALELSARGFVEGRDYLGLVSFAGTYTTQTEDVTTDQTLTTDFSDFSDRVAVLNPAGTGSSIAEALSAAYAELTSSRHDSSRRRAVVLVVDGAADVVDPGGTTADEGAAIAAAMAAASIQATAIKAADIKVVVVGYAVREDHQVGLADLATEGYDWFVSTSDELRTTLALLANSFCYNDGYYYTLPEGEDCFSAQQDYFDWINWDVIDGSTDLCGQGENGAAFWDVLPGNGLYMDLAGTLVGVTHNGTIRSKTTFAFTAGKTYKFSFYLAGWNVPEPATGREFEVQVSIENVLAAQTITVTDRLQPFTLYSYEFTPDSSTTGRIIIAQVTSFVSVGLLLDRVLLENVTDTVTMLDDDFDSENPCA